LGGVGKNQKKPILSYSYIDLLREKGISKQACEWRVDHISFPLNSGMIQVSHSRNSTFQDKYLRVENGYKNQIITL
jgi:hypothetical protein